jgi:HopJ type III effector protein
MSIEELIDRVRSGQPIRFQETIAVIDAHYQYSPCGFRNGCGDDVVINAPGTNEGSCKVFWFARLHGLDRSQTLALFGEYYRHDVLEHPDGRDHANVRRFLRDGWAGIEYEGVPLLPRGAYPDGRGLLS